MRRCQTSGAASIAYLAWLTLVIIVQLVGKSIISLNSFIHSLHELGLQRMDTDTRVFKYTVVSLNMVLL